MKKFTKILTTIVATALSVVLFCTLMACGVSGENYTFEAEDATLGGAAQAETGKHYWSGDLSNPGEEHNAVGYMTEEGASVTFKITAEKACKVEITLKVASSAMDMSQMWTGGDFKVMEVDLKTKKVFKLSVNGSEVAVEGTLPGLTLTSEQIGGNMFGVFDSPLCNYAEIKVVTQLKAGENTVVVESLGYKEGETSYGINFDKIIVKSPAKLS